MPSRRSARAATAKFPDADRLAGFLGLFMGVSNVTALLVSLFVANRLFARFGLATMVLCLPVICLNDNFLGYSVLGGVSLVFGFLAWLTSRGEIRGVAGVVHFSVEAGLVAGVGLFWLFVFMNYLSDLPGPILEERLESKNPYCALVSRWLDVLGRIERDLVSLARVRQGRAQRHVDLERIEGAAVASRLAARRFQHAVNVIDGQPV